MPPIRREAAQHAQQVHREARSLVRHPFGFSDAASHGKAHGTANLAPDGKAHGTANLAPDAEAHGTANLAPDVRAHGKANLAPDVRAHTERCLHGKRAALQMHGQGCLQGHARHNKRHGGVAGMPGRVGLRRCVKRKQCLSIFRSGAAIATCKEERRARARARYH